MGDKNNFLAQLTSEATRDGLISLAKDVVEGNRTANIFTVPAYPRDVAKHRGDVGISL